MMPQFAWKHIMDFRLMLQLNLPLAEPGWSSLTGAFALIFPRGSSVECIGKATV